MTIELNKLNLKSFMQLSRDGSLSRHTVDNPSLCEWFTAIDDLSFWSLREQMLTFSWLQPPPTTLD